MRKYYLDNLRWMDVLLLIPYHAAQAFNTWGEMNYVVFAPSKLLSSFIVFFSPFFMPLLFLLAGMSTKYALEKRTVRLYILERVKRLMVPFVFGTLVFCPVMAWMGDVANCGYSGSFFGHYRVFFTKWTDLSGFDGGFNVGQFWFLYFLFVISLLSLIVIRLLKNVRIPEVPFPVICLFVIPLPFLHDILSIGGKSIVEFLYIFLIGYYVMSSDTAMEKTEKYHVITLTVGLISAVLGVWLFLWSGLELPVVNNILRALAEWFMILGLLGIGKARLDSTGKVFTFFSARSFPYYSFHFFWLVLFQFAIRNSFNGNVAVMYIVPMIPALFLTFICSEVCLRVPFLSFLTGTKPVCYNKLR